MLKLIAKMHAAEDGHAVGLLGPLVAAAGAILLACGAADGSERLDIIGGIVIAVGILAGSVIHHARIEWPIYHRLDEIEKK
jgi:hypothetical protein